MSLNSAKLAPIVRRGRKRLAAGVMAASLATLLLCGALPARADTILTSTVDPFTGDFIDMSASYPLSPVTIGTFGYTVPGGGDVLVSATVSGYFGNSLSPTSAPGTFYVGTTQVASCAVTDPCYSDDQETF